MRYKLYKAGKIWLTAAITIFSTLAISSNVNADVNNNETNGNQQVVQTCAHLKTSQTTNDATNQVVTADGWQNKDNNWYYYQNGQAQTGWQNVSDNWYYLNPETNAMETGLQNIQNNIYCLNEQHNGTYGAMQTGWQNINGNWYNFANNGAAIKGWYRSNAGYWYHFNQDGQAQTGWQTLNNHNYYFDLTNASAVSGWQNIDDNWYYFDPINVWQMNGWQKINNQWFYFDSNQKGKMLSGLQQINGHGYYLNPNHDGSFGAMQNGWQLIYGRWFDFGGLNDGAAYTGWHLINNRWYYFNSDGEARVGWQSINNHRYYFDPINAWALTGWQLLSGKWYYFDQQNAWLLTGWQTLNGSQYYLDPETGQMATGYTLVNGHHYYFDLTSGHQVKGFFLDPTAKLLSYYDGQTGIQPANIIVNGKTTSFESTNGYLKSDNFVNGLNKVGNKYFLVENGTFARNVWRQINGSWYYFQDNGEATTDWYKSSAGFWYYFNHDGQALTNWQYINGRWYLFNNTNANAVTGWYQSDYGNWYYFDPVNAWADTNWQYINGIWYYFNPDDAWLDLNQTLTYNWQQIMGSYWNSSSIAIQLQRNGAEYATTNNPGLRYEVASTVKVAVLAMLLHNTGGNLDSTQQSLAMKMIRNSDNDATTTILTNYLGGITALSAIYSALGMNQTTAAPHWGSSLTVPSDQLKLLKMIYLDPSSNYLNDKSRNYIKWLMNTVSTDQSWGISAGSSNYYLKNGWRPASDNGLWEVNSIGYIPNGRNSYTIAIYTRNNRNFNWGVSYVEALARITRQIIG